jgi:hypothetical protein
VKLEKRLTLSLLEKRRVTSMDLRVKALIKKEKEMNLSWKTT